MKDYPLKTLLDQIAQTWGCDWRFLDKERKVVLVRALSKPALVRSVPA